MFVHLPWTSAWRRSFFGIFPSLLACFVGLATGLPAQTAHFSYAKTWVASGGTNVSHAWDVAADSSGNLYVAQVEVNTVVKETSSGGSYTESVIASGLNTPRGVAVDTNGNVYIADTYNNRVLKVVRNGSSYDTPITVTSTSGLYSPYGVAVDSSGNVFIADYGNYRVVKETWSEGAWNETVIAIGSGLGRPAAVAVDASGNNVYIVDSDNNRVLRETLSGGSYSQTAEISVYPNYPSGVTVDSSGNLYIVDIGDMTRSRLLKATPSGGGYNTPDVLIDVGTMSYSHGVAVDSSGNVYVADTGHVSSLLKFAFAGVNYGAVQVGAGAGTTTELIFKFDTAGLIAAPAVLTMGAPGQDFTDTGGGSCTIDVDFGMSENAGGSCAVQVRFGPQYTGFRKGAVVLRNTSGVPIATAYIYGNGVGPQIAFSPATQTIVANSALGTAFNGVFSVAVDGTGNLYFPDAYHNRVLKESLSGGSYTASVLKSGTASFIPQGIAVDGSGRIYISDSNSSVVFRETPSNGGYIETVVADGSPTNGDLWMPMGVAVDQNGNVYIADSLNNRVLKEKLNSDGSYTQTVVAGTGLTYPRGIGVDGSGNVYFTDGNPPTRMVKETLQADGSYVQTVLTFQSAINSAGLVVDGVGNLYIADGATDNYRVLKEALQTNGSYVESVIADTNSPYNLYNPQGVAVDGKGNVYIADSIDVMKENVADAPSLNFASTAAGVQSSDSPQTVTVSNDGNAVLTLPAPTDGLNPSVATYFEWDDGSSTCEQTSAGSGTPFTLAAGSSCTIGINFYPTTQGSINGEVVLTDDNLNASPSTTQSIPLAGTATAGAKQSQTITFNSPGSQNFGTSPTLTATSTSGLTVTFSSSTTGVCTITSVGVLTTVSAGSCTINADQAGDDTYDAAPQVGQTFSINVVAPGAPTIGTAIAGNTQATVSFTAPSSNGGASITGYTVTSSPGNITGTGATSPITVTGLTNGTAYTFAVTATNPAGTGAASAASNSVTPKASQTITFNSPGPQNFGTSPILTATSTSGLTVTFSSSTIGVCTITEGGELTTVSVGSCTINAEQAGNSAYLAATQVNRTFSINAVAPGAPTGVSATAGAAQATVSFTAPSSNGGASIIEYTVTSSPGGLTGTGASSPITVTGLTNGTTYTFTVTAANSAGTGVPSAPSNAVTPNATLTSITVNSTSSSVAAGLTQQFTATGHYSDGSTQDITSSVTWTSSRTAYATIASDGMASGVAKGRTIIIATLGSVSGSTNLTVTAPVVVSFVISPASATISTGQTQSFTANGTFSDGSTQDITRNVTWSSSDATVATISRGGLTKAVGVGGATITATIGTISETATLTVSAGLVSIAITPSNPSVAVGNTQMFTATGTYSGGSTQDLTTSATWTSSRTSIASIDMAGVATGNSAGKVRITATVGGISGSTTLTVTR